MINHFEDRLIDASDLINSVMEDSYDDDHTIINLLMGAIKNIDECLQIFNDSGLE